jgi:hypothetical protein
VGFSRHRAEWHRGTSSRLLRAEVDERVQAAEQLSAGGGNERAAVVRAEAAILAELLEEV